MTGSSSASDRRRPARRVLLTWLALTLIAVLVSAMAGDRMRRGIFDSWQALQPRDLSQTDVRVVLIDNRSIEYLGPWPWPRYYLARMAEELAKRDAKVIAVDVLLSEHDRVNPDAFAALYPEMSAGAASEIKGLVSMDQAFATVIGSAPVVLGHAGVDEAPVGQPPLADAAVSGKASSRLDHWPAELAAIPELDDVALTTGLLNVRPDVDGVVRSTPLVMRAGGKLRSSFSAEIARVALGVDMVKVRPASVEVGDRKIPIDGEGRMRIHFGEFPASKIISAEDLLDQEKPLDPALVAGKPVLIGVSAEGTSDIAATPLRAEEYGPLIQAQAVDAILRGGWLSRPAWAGPAEWVAAALLALLALGNAVFGRANRLILALLFAVVPVISWLAFSRTHLLLDPARPLLVGGGAVAGVAIGLFALARLDRERLREALVHERVVAAETQGELQAARAIQLGMVPPRARLDQLDPRVDLDALLEPARSVGGDYYDALKIDGDRLGFAIADVTGKGVPAALFMAMSKALTSAALSRMQADPAGMADAINAELLKDNSEAMSVTMLLGILNLKTGDVQLVCAGHEDPLLIDCDGDRKRIRLDGGPPFSITEFPYPLEHLKLKPGETLVLVTDGVTEAQNAGGDLFGRDRILSGRGEWARSAGAIVECIRDEVRAFEAGTEATDDLTVMAIRFLGAA
jgi:serine phosphatase RsbU (regulator of sigma subunit)/CHASE2 domain-containing sensor protein